MTVRGTYIHISIKKLFDCVSAAYSLLFKVYVDFEKAFDKVENCILQNKLKKIGINAKLSRCVDTQFSIKPTTMCCRQWNNIKWSSSQKWRTPMLSVRAPPVPNTYIWNKWRNRELNSIMLCRWYSNPSRNKRWKGHTGATKWFTQSVQMGRNK